MKERESMSNHQNKISQAKEFQREQVAEVGVGFDVLQCGNRAPKNRMGYSGGKPSSSQ
uniref:Uncharacterized protein n=1 Tax=Daphnia galeata TaxID=27404 RepID=A0A8J2W3M0_9CRUS|nr:unnamed protein product [Daphnia galeata]